MSIKSIIGVAAALTIGMTMASLAQKARVPKIDIHRVCQGIDADARDFHWNGSHDAVSGCVATEKEAHSQIIREWSTFPAAARSQCIQPDTYMPTYVRWLTCLELTRDAMKLRKG
jgi:hypothetical protein